MKLFQGLSALALCCAFFAPPALAECCGPAPVAPEQFQLGSGWSGSLFYEHMDMKTLLRGSDEISADQVLTERLQAGATRYSVPTRMFMDRASVQLRYQFDPEHSLRVTLPWRFNQMDMRMASQARAARGGHAHHKISLQMDGHPGHHAGGHQAGTEHTEHDGHDGETNQAQNTGHEGNTGGHARPAAGSPMFMDMTMQQVDGLGDINLTYNYAFDLDGHNAWVGAGVALPTGDWDVRDRQGQLIHNMMQPGSGALGLTIETGADFRFAQSRFSLHPRASVQWNATNPLGYQRGARFDYELGTRYRVHDRVGLSLDLIGFAVNRDSTNGTLDPVTGQVAFQRPETSMADDVANTGGEFLFLAPGLRVNPTDDIAIGAQYRLPIYQNVRGTQLGIDSWYRVFLSAKF